MTAVRLRLICRFRAPLISQVTEKLCSKVFGTLLRRLRKNWSDFLYLRDKSSTGNLLSPSTAPCNPAPGRRLLIMRNDTQIDPDTVFLSFDGVFPSLPNQPTAYKEHSSLAQLSQIGSPLSRLDGDHLRLVEPSGSPPKKRWGLLRNILPFSSPLSDSLRLEDGADTPKPTSGTVTPGSPADNGEDLNGNPTQNKARPTSKDAGTKQETPQHRCRSFKFSLEWIEKPNYAGKDRRLSPPRLPMPAQMFLQSKASETDHIPDHESGTRSPECSKYSGRALAEWAVVVIECQNFFERRKAEGVPTDELVETPSLGVETFRKFG